MDLVRWIVPFLVAVMLFWIIGWLTGNKEYGSKDDERSRFIKRKAIAGSWTFMLMVVVINVVLDFFDLRTGPLKNAPFDHPELLYLLVLVGSYFVYYWIYSRRLSSNEK